MEDESFEASMIKLYPKLYLYAYSLVNDNDTAKDLVQETCLKGLRKRHTFEPGTNLKAWLFRILYHLFVNNYHKLKNGDVRFNQSSANETYSTDEISPQTDFLSFEINAAIAKLPISLSTVIVLYAKGYKYIEIAKMLAIPEGTVKNRIHVARRRLRCILS